MATYRQVQTTFWQDGFVLSLTPEEKYFYLYLMTNSKTTQCGIYELPKRVIEMETGYNRETVDKLLDRFVNYNKIKYHEKTQEIIVVNWLRYNSINSPKVKACIVKELKTVKNPAFIEIFYTLCKRYKYSIDTVSIDLGEEEEKEKEQEEEQEVEEIKDIVPFSEIITYLNEKVGTRYRASTEATKRHINARWTSGYRIDDFKAVIDKKCAEWIGTDMEQYLCPDTLFGTKFEKYLNQKTVIKGGVSDGKYGRRNAGNVEEDRRLADKDAEHNAASSADFWMRQV
ncbi:conserved phage C-terminal domain-containing protein [Paenibacillus spongiae]|uniref:Conserved phage C-terminal domain-containing protein n=1 Tax=Paenibacillus spongiae TaxID=2909671 RepID=A0ABY5SB62_9BACL|nr:conserved phage C-terminal domain-containing protein [Paenibacillus spongiae]UVI31192.1 conserved phage C-terminal domain-containing protein [Paenibacillus spongiae]